MLVQEALKLMPEGPALYSQEAVTDETLEQRISEYIREAALEGAREELPHSLAVTSTTSRSRRG